MRADVAVVRKVAALIVVALALTGCSAKSVEVATETTLDPTATTAVPTTVKTDRIYQCTVVMREAMAGIETTLSDGSSAYYAEMAGLAEAQQSAVTTAVQTAAKCQLLLPECTTPAAQWVQGVKTYAETYVANVFRLARGGVSVIPMMKPVAAVDPSCA